MESLRSYFAPRRVSVKIVRGFTLVELMVVLAIIAIITVVVVASQSSFNKSLVLANTAYDIALTLRSAETYGLGSRASGGVANAGYGVHFQGAPSGTFVFFADTSPDVSCSTPDCKPGDHLYTLGADAIVQTYTLGNGMTVSDFCAISGVSESCAIAHGGGLSSLDIVFARPNPDAFITAGGSSYASACITITSPQGGLHYISVSSSGGISANASVCP